MVIFRKFSPAPELQEIVRGIEVLHMVWEEGVAMPSPEITCLANTEQNLYFYPHEPIVAFQTATSAPESVPFSIVTGPKVKPVKLKFGRDYLMIKVQFYPTGLYRLLGKPMQPLINIGMDAREYLDDLEPLYRLLQKEATYEMMVECINQYLSDKISKRVLPEEPIDIVARQMLDPTLKYSLEDWAAKACLSLRQFERSFRQRVGISPKLYTRIVRFERAMRIKESNPSLSWSQVAFECDYNDSSHLLREFRQFAHFPPGSHTKFQTSGHGDFPSG